MNLSKTLDSFVSDFCDGVWNELREEGVEGVGVTGSYVRGEYSKSRPDINFAVFTKESTSSLRLGIGQVTSRLNKKYSELVNLRPELHPERFAFPWGRDSEKLDVFFKVAIFEKKLAKEPMPFGRPGFISEAHKKSLKVVYGIEYLGDIDFESSNEEVLKAVCYVLDQWKRKMSSAPLAYNLIDDVDLFFNESLVWGKLAIQQYAWIQGLKNGFDYSKEADREKVFEKVHDKEQLRKYIELEGDLEKNVSLILDARLHFYEWKNDFEKAKEVYEASEVLMEEFLNTAESTDL